MVAVSAFNRRLHLRLTFGALRRVLPALWLVFGLLAWFAAPASCGAQPARGPVYTIEVDGVISAAHVNAIQRALRLAESARATALVISVGGEGGVLRAIRPLAREIAAASVPVVVFVRPAGAQSGLPGALLLSAAHVSALAPGASFGSPRPLAELDGTLSAQTRAALLDGVTDELRSWNVRGGRSPAWLDQAVTGVIITSQQAVGYDPPAVNLVAGDLPQLLTLLDGRTVMLADGTRAQLSTLGSAPIAVTPGFWDGLLLTLASPTVVFALLILAAAGVYLELVSPGITLFAGVGLIALVGAAYGLLALPVVSWALGALLLGLVLIGLEFVSPSHGGLLIGGLVLLVIGAVNLFDTQQAPGAAVSPLLIGVTGLGLAGLACGGVYLAMRTRHAPPRTGPAALVGQVAEVRSRLAPEGMVFVDGALWRAVSEDGDAAVGDFVQVVAVHRLELIVRRVG